MKTKENIHAGHRQRLREQIDATGLYNLSDLHFLEQLLTYTITRANTNTIAHALLNEFKSIDNIFEASVESLMSVKGVGEKTARFLQYMSAVAYMSNKSKVIKKPFVGNITSALTFVTNILPPTDNEQFVVLIINKNFEVKNYKIFKGISHSYVDFDSQELFDFLVKHKSSFCIIAHTHPHHSAMPSASDYNMFEMMNHNLNLMRIKLIDNLILGEQDFYSSKIEETRQYNDFSDFNYVKNRLSIPQDNN